MGIEDNKFWRIFAAITFLNQIIRVPLLLSIAISAKDLEAYFVIAATSIPVQFIALDILQYRSKSHSLLTFERFGLPFFAFGSVAYVAWNHGLVIGGVYLIFAAAILMYGASVGYLRDLFPATRVLAMDAIYNTGSTFAAAIVVILIKDGSQLGYAVILSQAGVGFVVCFINLMAVRRMQNKVTPVAAIATPIGNNLSTPLVLTGIMATTQLERLIIATSQPGVLACISLAAGAMQAWRKIGFDDALVFERLRGRNDRELYNAMRSELKHARYVFYPLLALVLIASNFSEHIAAWCSSHRLFRSLAPESYGITASILSIYLAVMPPGIVMINTLRQRVVALNYFGWVTLIVVALMEFIALVMPHVFDRINLTMVTIILTASLSHTLFMALCPVRFSVSFRLLFFDIGVFSLIVGKLILV